MNNALKYLPRARSRPDQAVVQEVGEELVVYNLERQTFHALNAIASRVWRWSDGHTTIDEMARRLAAETSLDEVRGRASVTVGLRRLQRAGLLEGAPVVPADAKRREVLRRAARAALAPVVASMLAPTRVAAVSVCGFCSCLTAGSPCSTTQGGNHRACRSVATGSCLCAHFSCPPGYLTCSSC